MVRLRPLAFAFLLVGCPSTEEEPTPPPHPPPGADDDDDPGRGAPPWLVVEIQSEDSDALLRRINDLSGYMRIGLYDVQPPFDDPEALAFTGPVNPAIKLLDMDGDGTPDATADVDVPSIEGGTPIATILIASTAVNDARELTVGIRAVDFLGNVVASADSEERVTFAVPGVEPAFVSVGPVDVDGSVSPPCRDEQDNDGDGWTDAADPDCDGGAALETGVGTTACNDGVDNDGDGGTDSGDGDCLDARSLSELPGCEDGVDNDGDGWIDAADPDCETGGPEQGRSGSGCNNGLDDDEDGRVDALDTGCAAAGGSED